MQNSLRCKLRSDTLRFFSITQISQTLELLRLTKLNPRRQMAWRWELAKCYFYHISGFRSFGNGLGYVSPFRVSVSSFLA